MGFTSLFKKKEKLDVMEQDRRDREKRKSKLDKEDRKIDRKIKQLDRMEGDRKGKTWIGKVNKGMDKAGDAFDGFKKSTNDVFDTFGGQFGAMGGSSSGGGRKTRDSDYGFGGFDMGSLGNYGSSESKKKGKGKAKKAKRSSNYWDMDIDNF